MKRFLAITVLLTTCSGAFACPMCKDSASNAEGNLAASELKDQYTANGQGMAAGLNTSIYVMLGVLFGIMGLVSTVIVKGIRHTDTASKRREIRQDL
jgi:hypothetical protein